VSNIIEITGDGTFPFLLESGSYRLDIEGTLASGFSAALKAGASADGSDHAAVPNPFNVAVVFSGSTPITPPVLMGAGWYSLVVTGYSGSASVQGVLRKADIAR
jgi:hypothetical protein